MGFDASVCDGCLPIFNTPVYKLQSKLLNVCERSQSASRLSLWNAASYDDYSAAMESRMRQAYDLVRQELGVKAERIKRHYDLRVRPQKFRTGEWILYYNLRSYQGRQQKWERIYSPYLIIKEIPPVNYLIQKSKRSRPIICHVDKLKKWTTDDPPKSWLTSNEQ